ncbi:MAG: hypothetical protein AAFX99_10605, partial [Myxococcota bacterium]
GLVLGKDHKHLLLRPNRCLEGQATHGWILPMRPTFSYPKTLTSAPFEGHIAFWLQPHEASGLRLVP